MFKNLANRYPNLPGPIYLFSGGWRACKVYLIDRELIIDTGTNDLLGRVNALKEIKKSRIETSEINKIVNTHGHYDHICGNAAFEKATGAELYAHDLDMDKIQTGKDSCNKKFFRPKALSKIDNPIKEGDTIETENYRFTVLHTPGHTSGSICLYEPEKKILISGDTLFFDGYGATDLPTGSKSDMNASLRKLRELEVDFLLPGH